jgi:hypothetical protein
MALVLASVRSHGMILSWHWAAYPVGILLASAGAWSLATGHLPWRPPARSTSRLHDLHPRFFFAQAWRDLNALAFGEADRPRKGRRDDGRRARVDHRVIVVYVVAALSLTLMEYFGDRTTLLEIWPAALTGRYGELNGFAYWSLWRFVGYAVIPAVAVVATPGMHLAECGVSFKGFFEHLWIYAVLFVIVLAMVVFVSYKPDFQSYYPFYEQAHRSWFDFLAWEGLYALQFVSLEFFFRGFMLHPVKRSFGAYAILAMMVPYCMIHYGKPYLEANAAIVAGLVLGTLSLRTGSIWCGALIHITVAVSMDVAALWQSGHLALLVG